MKQQQTDKKKQRYQQFMAIVYMDRWMRITLTFSGKGFFIKQAPTMHFVRKPKIIR